MRNKFDNYEFRFDESSYRFVKTIRVSRMFFIPYRESVLYDLKLGRRLRIVRSEGYFNDTNDIRIENSFPWGYRIGYIPRKDAKYFISQMENGVYYVGRIKSLERRNTKIMVDIYERIPLQISEVSSLKYYEGGYYIPSISVKFSLRTRTFVYQKHERRAETFQQVSIHFTGEQWKNFVMPALQATNFVIWLDKYLYGNGVSDTIWSLKIRLGKKGVRKIEGISCFPENWAIFQKFISDCLKLDNAEHQSLPETEQRPQSLEEEYLMP